MVASHCHVFLVPHPSIAPAAPLNRIYHGRSTEWRRWKRSCLEITYGKKGKQQLHHQRQNAKQLLTIHVKIVFTYFMLLPSRF